MGDGSSSTVFSFAGFRLDARRRLLCDANGQKVPLTTKAFDTLLYLVDRAGEVVTKAELLRAVWPGVVVEENNLSQCVSALRRALGESSRAPDFIVTVPGRGYRFIAEVFRSTATSSPPSVPATPSGEPVANLFAMQDAIAERVASAVVEKVAGGERQRPRRRPTSDAQAYQLYVNGWSALTRPSGTNLERGLRYFEQAVQLDPGFALAYICMADCWALLGVFGMRAPHEVFPRAREAVLNALAVEPLLAEAHAELGHILWVYDLDAPRAQHALQRALEIDPTSPMALHYLGLTEAAQGRLDEALATLRRAQAAEPLAVNINTNIGMIHYYARRYADAVAQAKAALELDHRFEHAYSVAGRALLHLGDYDGALEQFRARQGTTIGDDADVPTVYALAGDLAAARRELERLLREREQRYVSAHAVATINAALGEKNAALDWLERAFDERAQPIGYLLVDPLFDGFHDEPRFQQLIEKMRLR